MLRQRADERAVRAVAVFFRMRVFFQTAERRLLRRWFVTGVGVRMFFQRADQRAGLVITIRGVGMFLMPAERRARRSFRLGRFVRGLAAVFLLRQNAEAEKSGLVQRVLSDAPSAETSATRATWSA